MSPHGPRPVLLPAPTPAPTALEMTMNTGRAVLGITFVSLGGLLLLDRADVLDAGPIIADWWPVLLLVAALLELLARPARKVSAAVFAVLGLLLLVATTDVLSASAWSLVWPSLIILLGAWLLLRGGRVPDGVHTDQQDLDVTAVFSGRKVVSTAAAFRRGSATAVFGGVDLDLGAARIDGEATLDLVALFGGVELAVPFGWRVLLDGPAIFGGHENHVPPPTDPNAPTLRVNATAIFGGVEVKLATSPRMAPA